MKSSATTPSTKPPILYTIVGRIHDLTPYCWRRSELTNPCKDEAWLGSLHCNDELPMSWSTTTPSRGLHQTTRSHHRPRRHPCPLGSHSRQAPQSVRPSRAHRGLPLVDLTTAAAVVTHGSPDRARRHSLCIQQWRRCERKPHRQEPCLQLKSRRWDTMPPYKHCRHHRRSLLSSAINNLALVKSHRRGKNHRFHSPNNPSCMQNEREKRAGERDEKLGHVWV